MAVALGDEAERGLAEDFGRRHPSDRMRLAAWDALALGEADAAGRESVWRRAQASGNRLLAGEARRRLALLRALALPLERCSGEGVDRALQDQRGGMRIDPFRSLGAAEVLFDHRPLGGLRGPAFVPQQDR